MSINFQLLAKLSTVDVYIHVPLLGPPLVGRQCVDEQPFLQSCNVVATVSIRLSTGEMVALACWFQTSVFAPYAWKNKKKNMDLQ